MLVCAVGGRPSRACPARSYICPCLHPERRRTIRLSMRRCYRSALFLAVVAATVAAAPPSRADSPGARWRSNGPFGGDISALAADPSDPSIVYAGTAGDYGAGIFLSADGGATWSATSLPLTINTSS